MLDLAAISSSPDSFMIFSYAVDDKRGCKKPNALDGACCEDVWPSFCTKFLVVRLRTVSACQLLSMADSSCPPSPEVPVPSRQWRPLVEAQQKSRLTPGLGEMFSHAGTYTYLSAC